MKQVWIIDENGYYQNESKFVEEVTELMTTVQLLVGYVKPKLVNNEWIEGATEEEKQEWKDSQQIDISVVKEKKVSNSKGLLASWLVSNPLFSTIHTAEGEYYTVTEDKQSQLTQMITLFNLATQTGTEFKLTWNSTGGVCEEWTIEELTTLAFQITEYVLPRVKKQQAYEVAINACDTLEEVEAIEINYEAV